MSTAATRRGHCRHAVELQRRASVRNKAVWWTNTFHGGRHEENHAVWCRFSEFNQLPYYKIRLLRRSFLALLSAWEIADLKRVYRWKIERAGRCLRVPLP